MIQEREEVEIAKNQEIENVMRQNSVLLRAVEEERQASKVNKWAKLTDISTELISLNTRVLQLSQINLGSKNKNQHKEEIKAILASI